MAIAFAVPGSGFLPAGAPLPSMLVDGDIILPKAEWGTKRTCLSCGARFYDFARSSIACPACDAPFDLEVVARTRRTRASKAAGEPEEAKKVEPEKVAVAREVEESDDEEAEVDDDADDEDVDDDDSDEDDDADTDDDADEDDDKPASPLAEEEEDDEEESLIEDPSELDDEDDVSDVIDTDIDDDERST